MLHKVKFIYKVSFMLLLCKSVYTHQNEEKCTKIEQIENLNKTTTFLIIGFVSILNSIPTRYLECGIVMSEAMKYAIKEANKMILPSNIQLGYRIYDDCGETQLHISSEVALRLSLDDPTKNKFTDVQMRHQSVCQCTYDSYYNFPVGVVGPSNSAASKHVSELISFMNIPMISYLATSIELNNKKLYPNFFRTITSDSMLTKAILDIVIKYAWSYVSVLSSDNSYGWNGRNELLERFKRYGVCIDIDELFSVPYKNDQVQLILKKVKEKRKSIANVIILFGAEGAAQFILRVAEDEKLNNITWIITDGSSLSEWYLDIDYRVIQGLITISHYSGKYKTFEEFFWNITYNSSHGDLFIESFFNIHNGTRMIDFKNLFITFMNYAVYVRNAVFSYAHAFRNYVRDNTNCLNTPTIYCNMNSYNRTLFIEKYLKEVTFTGLMNEHFTFNSFKMVNYSMFRILNIAREGEVLVIKTIGSWSPTKRLSITDQPYWNSGSPHVPISKCSELCKPGYYPIYDAGNLCCWICVQCKIGTIKNSYGNSSCTTCPDSRTNHNRTQCAVYKRISGKDFIWNLYILIPMCVIGSVLSFGIILMWIRYKSSPIVKASNYRLSIMQISIQLILFLTLSNISVVKVNAFTCIFGTVIVGIEIVVVISLLTIKAEQLLRAFKSKVKINNYEVLVTKSVGYAILFFTILIELCFTGALILLQGVKVEIKYYENLTKEQTCEIPILAKVQALYAGILCIICGVQAFRSHNLPSKFNEAKSILYSVFSIIICTSVMFLLRTSAPNYTQLTSINAMCIAIANLSILIIMYGYKSWNLCFNKNKHTVQIYQRDIFTNVNDLTNREIHLRKNNDFS